MYLKTLRVQLKDLFIEMREEKQKLLKEIELLKDFRNCLNSFVKCCKCDENVINANKYIANQLENQYLTSFEANLVIKNPNSNSFGVKLAKKEEPNIFDVKTKNDVLIDAFIEDEVIINDNILEIDCRQLSDDLPLNQNISVMDCTQTADNCLKQIQFEVIPKKENTFPEVIDLEPEEPTVEPKFSDLELVMNGNKDVINAEESHSIGTSPKMTENRFSYLSSFVSQTQNSDEFNSMTNFSANNVNHNSGLI